MFKKIGNFIKNVDKKIKDFLFKNRYGTIMLLVGLIVAFWDLALKHLLDGKNMSAINGVFNIFSTHNTGGAWSIFSGATTVLIIVTIIFILAIIAFNYVFKQKNYFYAVSMGLLLSGAICNLFDRIKYGYVRDFINLEFINFPVFNIADMAICIGIILLAIYFIFVMPKLERYDLQEVSNDAKSFIETYKISSNSNEQNETNSVYNKSKYTPKSLNKQKSLDTKTNKKANNAK